MAITPTLLAPSFTLPAVCSDLIICQGQSNDIAQPSLPPNAVVPTPQPVLVPFRPVLIDEYKPPPKFWRPLAPLTRNLAVNATLGAAAGELGALVMKWGWWLQLGKRLLAAGRTPVFSLICRSGQPTSYWQSGIGKATLDAELAYLNSVPQLAAATRKWLVTFDGESNATSAPLAAAYQAERQAINANVRATFPTAKLLLSQVSINFTVLAQRAAVQTAQQAVVAADGNAVLMNWDNGATYPVNGTGPHYLYTALSPQGDALFAQM